MSFKGPSLVHLYCLPYWRGFEPRERPSFLLLSRGIGVRKNPSSAIFCNRYKRAVWEEAKKWMIKFFGTSRTKPRAAGQGVQLLHLCFVRPPPLTVKFNFEAKGCQLTVQAGWARRQSSNWKVLAQFLKNRQPLCFVILITSSSSLWHQEKSPKEISPKSENRF